MMESKSCLWCRMALVKKSPSGRSAMPIGTDGHRPPQRTFVPEGTGVGLHGDGRTPVEGLELHRITCSARVSRRGHGRKDDPETLVVVPVPGMPPVPVGTAEPVRVIVPAAAPDDPVSQR